MKIRDTAEVRFTTPLPNLRRRRAARRWLNAHRTATTQIHPSAVETALALAGDDPSRLSFDREGRYIIVLNKPRKEMGS